MNPQLEFFLEDAFNSVRPTSPEVGRVVVEPDYDVSPDEQERDDDQCHKHQRPGFL